MAIELFDFWAIVFFSLVGVVLATRLGLPSVLGVLFFGALVGPYGLGLVGRTEFVELLSELGAILLLFFMGIEFRIDRMLQYGLRAVVVFALKFGIVFLVTYLAALALDFPLLDALLIGLLLSFSSTVVFARLVSGSVAAGRQETVLISAVLILEDIVAIFALTLLSQLRSFSTISIETVLVPVFVALLVLSFSYIVLRWLVLRLSVWLDEKNIEAQLFSALSLCAFLSSLAVFFGLSPAIGAFLAGGVFSSVAVFKRVEHALQQMLFLFSAFFFFSMGMLANPVFLQATLPLVLLFTVLTVLLKFLSVSFSSYLLGFESRSSIFSGVLMLPVSEFALLIALQAAPLVSFDLVSFCAALLFLSSLATALLFPFEASLNAQISRRFPEGIRSRLQNLSTYMDRFIRRFEPEGEFYQLFRLHAQQLVFDLAAFALVFSFFAIVQPILTAAFPYFVGPLYLFDAVAVSLLVYPSFRILRTVHLLLSEFTAAFHSLSKQSRYLQGRVRTDIFFFFVFFGLAFLIPIALAALSLPHFLQSFSLLPLAISFVFVWDLAQAATGLLGRRSG